MIDVHENRRVGRCIHMFRYTYAGINIINKQIEKGDRHRSRVKRTFRAP